EWRRRPGTSPCRRTGQGAQAGRQDRVGDAVQPEQCSQQSRPHDRPLGPPRAQVRAAAGTLLHAGQVQQRAVFDSGRADRLAVAAAQTVVQVEVADGRGFDRPQRPGPRQRDPAARGFRLKPVVGVGRADRQAQPALDAAVRQRHGFVRARPGLRGSLSGRGVGHSAMLAWAVRWLAVSRESRYHSASFVPQLHAARQTRGKVPVRPLRDTYPESARPGTHRRPVMKTFTAKNETVQRDWYLVDATGKTLGRLAAELAHRLRGKHKPVYTPHVDTGDYLVVINAEKIAVTGNKLADKKYHRFTGYIGNLKTETLGQALERHPERVIEIAVKGMLPKNPLG